jgi:hypothetical protein
VARAATVDSERILGSLSALEETGARIVLTGHGAVDGRDRLGGAGGAGGAPGRRGLSGCGRARQAAIA